MLCPNLLFYKKEESTQSDEFSPFGLTFYKRQIKIHQIIKTPTMNMVCAVLLSLMGCFLLAWSVIRVIQGQQRRDDRLFNELIQKNQYLQKTLNPHTP